MPAGFLIKWRKATSKKKPAPKVKDDDRRIIECDHLDSFEVSGKLDDIIVRLTNIRKELEDKGFYYIRIDWRYNRYYYLRGKRLETDEEVIARWEEEKTQEQQREDLLKEESEIVSIVRKHGAEKVLKVVKGME